MRLLKVSLFLIFLTGCKTNPVDRLVNPNPDGSVPLSGGIYMIYEDELKTGGGLGFIPSSGNQSIDLFDHSSPRRTINALMYSWNGGSVTNFSTTPPSAQHLFAGFSLTLTEDLSGIASATGKDLSAAGYTKVKFSVRGSLSSETKLRVEGPSDGSTGFMASRAEYSTLSSVWEDKEINITPAHFSNVKIFITVSFQYDQPPRTTDPGSGGIVYFDDIRYE